MKTHLLCLLLAALLLMLCGCGGETSPEEDYIQPFTFYYRSVDPDYSSADGPIGTEVRDLGPEALTDEALINLYLQGPLSAELRSPFPPNVRLLSVSGSTMLLRLQLSSEYAQLQGVDASIADACIAKTLLGLENVRRVRIVSVDDAGNELRGVTLSENDILLSDAQTDTDKLDLTLYFADADGRYLLTEKRTVAARPASELPQLAVELLLEGPQTTGLYPTMPVGTVLLDLNVENGVCALDFSAEFLQNRAALGLPPHLTLLSIANTLAELDGVDQIQLFIEGRQELSLGPFPLTQTYNAEARAVGPSHPDLNEQDCTLYLPVGSSAELYALPLRVRRGSNVSAAETLLRLLFAYAPQNGLDNPWYEQPMPDRISLENGVCTVELAEDGVPGDSDAARALALRILSETLQAQEDVESVQILVGERPA